MSEPIDIPSQIARSLSDLCSAQATLQRLGIIRSQRMVADFGEWFASQLLSMSLCSNRTQQGWDLESSGKRIQVKTHAKALTNRARRTTLRKDALEFDELAVVVLTETYRVRAFYLVPREAVETLAPYKDGKRVLSWNALKSFELRTVPVKLRPLLSDDSHMAPISR
jgi:hypothetical protein